MIPTMPYSLAFVCIFLTASLSVLGQSGEDCVTKTTCHECLSTVIPREIGNNGTCAYEVSSDGMRCVHGINITELVISAIFNLAGCSQFPDNTTTTTVAPTTSTVAPSNTTTTAPPTPPTPPPTNATTTSPTTTSPPTPFTNGTTTVPTTTIPTNGTTPTPAPSNSTTTTTAAPPTTAKPTPTPSGFAWGEFFGGIVFAIALSSLAYLIWRFYKARLDRNYHTFSNPTF